MSDVVVPFFRSPYNFDRSEASFASGLSCEDPSLAQQSFQEEVDINFLLERFKVTGHLPQGAHMPSYGDFDGVSDYRSAMSVLLKAQQDFMALPANVRARFGNDPQMFLEFCSDSSNLDEMRKLGLAVPLDSVSVPPSGTPEGGAAAG